MKKQLPPSAPPSPLSGYKTLRAIVARGNTDCMWPTGNWERTDDLIKFKLLTSSKSGSGSFLEIIITEHDLIVNIQAEPN